MASVNSEDTSSQNDEYDVEKKRNELQQNILRSSSIEPSLSPNSINSNLDNISPDLDQALIYKSCDENESSGKSAETVDGKILIKPKRPSKPKCNVCQKRLKLLETTIGKCKCDNLYCGKHRMPEDHHCEYDFKEDARNKLKKNNPKVTKDKLNRL